MEAGVLALSRLRIRQLMREGNSSASDLMDYLDRPENFLWTILIGNTLANFIAVSLMVWLLHLWLMNTAALLLAFLVLVFSFYAFFELLPKMLFRLYPNTLTLFLAKPFRFLHFLIAPLVFMVSNLSNSLLGVNGGKRFRGQLFGSREEMRLVMQESSQGLTSEERLMINRVLDLQSVRVKDIAIPMSKAVGVSIETPMTGAIRLGNEQKISRLPVWRDEAGRRKVVGIVSLRAVVFSENPDLTKPAGDFLKPALYLDQDTRLEIALKRMQRSGQRLGIVLNANQIEIGVISLQDILKFIFGEVRL